MTLLAVIHLVSAAAVAGVQASRAADLAALAGADIARGLAAGDPCSAAAETVSRNAAEFVDCRVGGEFETEVRVTAAVEPTFVLLPAGLTLPGGSAERTSRAGPPEALAEDADRKAPQPHR